MFKTILYTLLFLLVFGFLLALAAAATIQDIEDNNVGQVNTTAQLEYVKVN